MTGAPARLPALVQRWHGRYTQRITARSLDGMSTNALIGRVRRLREESGDET